MSFSYEEIVPWGRSYAEYVKMLNLSDNDLKQKILGCGDGPANFNAEMFKNGNAVVSCDPIYQFTGERIKSRIDATYQNVIAQTTANQNDFIWKDIASPDELGRIRMDAMTSFLDDYDQGKNEGRYINARLPSLPFDDSSFDLALCAHFLFFYSDNLSLEFHKESILEMCRVASEVRIFPILNYNSKESAYVAPIIGLLEQSHFKVSIKEVSYEFQRGGNKMMKVSKQQIT